MSAQDFVAAIDAFMGARKKILGADQPYQWGVGYNPHEVKARFPLEVGGEAREEARLEIVGFPQAKDLKFRLSVCWSAAICRLDFTDETHPNTLSLPSEGIPPYVTGPHYHSWPLNKRFFRGMATPKLHNAEPFTTRASFDSVLRWFCQETNIDQLNGGHLIALPPRDKLL